jgi:hypothetical protein
MPTFNRIALLDTSSARKVQWGDGQVVSAEASPRLLELLAEGYEVWVVSTRTTLYPEGADECLFELIPPWRILHAREGMDNSHAGSAGLIELWARALEAVGLEGDLDLDYVSWLDLRQQAADQGIVVS